MATTLQTRRFTITKVNDTGFQAAEEPGMWFNLSKYAKPAPTIPPVSSRVEATVDLRGFVLAIEPVNQNGVVHEPPMPTASPDATATRLAVLDIAARFLATRTEAKSTDVLVVAEKWEAWVSRWPSCASEGKRIE